MRGFPKTLPDTLQMRRWWADKIMQGGPYVDPLPHVFDPQLSLLDVMEARHGGVDRDAQPVSRRVGDLHGGGRGTVSESTGGI